MVEHVRAYAEMPTATLPPDFAHRVGPFLADMYERYGPIFKTREAANEMVYLVGPEANRFVLLSDRLKFSHYAGWGTRIGVEGAFGNGLITMDGAEHADHRRMMNPAFAITYMDRYLPIMDHVIREHIVTWRERGEVDVYEEARKITFDIAAETLMGLRPGIEVDRFRELYVAIMALSPVDGDWDGYMTHLNLLTSELSGMLRAKIVARRQQPADDLLGILVRARDQHRDPLSDEQLIAHCNTLLIAGHETSTSLSAWLLYLLSEHPAYTQRVLAEQAALGTDEADPPLEAIQRMKVLENALSEAERLYPPVTLGPRGVIESFAFNGYHVPAGTPVFYAIAASHLIPSIFADPTRFDPDRFAPPREEHKRTPYALVGFGGGPRICLGINFAKVEIKALARHVLLRYDVEPLSRPYVHQFSVASRPTDGIRLRVRERKQATAT